MIYLPRQQLLIITPPKCATHSLHKLLCSDRYGGVTIVGASLGSVERVDRHTATVPVEAQHCRKLIVVRNPFDRLVSLYHHLVTFEAGYGRATPAFWQFANQVGRGEIVDPFYAWNLTRFYRHVGSDGILRVESLAADLRAAGLDVPDELPREHAAHRFRPVAEYFDASTLAAVARWAAPDADRWGYEPPSEKRNVAGAAASCLVSEGKQA